MIDSTYHTPYRILVKRVPADTHHHRPDPSSSSFFAPLGDSETLRIDIDAGPAVVHSTLHFLVPADAEPGERDIGRRDAEFAAAAAETFDDGTGEGDGEWRGGSSGGAGEGGAWPGGTVGGHLG